MLEINNIKNRIVNDIELDESSVWVFIDKKKFSYSEGPSSEDYIKKVFLSAHDLSSNSYELERWIKDWPSEYHLTRKRAQLLRGFNFEKTRKVLEVGCGCGAITRFLGETFDNVVAIEGSLERAKLARLRTRNMDNVSIICSPFQEIKFKERFDIIFCIGVFEYSSMYVDAQDPFDYIIKYFHDILTPDGEIVVAIENQFGLKYFSSAREDHNNIMFDGLEGYPRYSKKERTFGYGQLKGIIKKYFENINFYFPYPDYKTPSCILSERFLYKAKAGQLVGLLRSSRFMGKQSSFFDERLTLLELDKNNMLPFFSNSFLIVASKHVTRSTELKSLGLVYSSNRAERFQTITNFIEQEDGAILVEKKPANGADEVKSEFLILHRCHDKWINGLSIHSQIMRLVKERNITIEELFAPAKIWFSHLKSLASYDDNGFFLEGKYVDCIWSNSFIINGECQFIDLEFEWHEKINIKVLLVRCLYTFLNDISNLSDLNSHLKTGSKRILIKKIAKSIGIEINKSDFEEFSKLESIFGHIVSGQNIILCRFRINLVLWNEVIFSFISSIVMTFRTISNMLLIKFQNIVLKLRTGRFE